MARRVRRGGLKRWLSRRHVRRRIVAAVTVVVVLAGVSVAWWWLPPSDLASWAAGPPAGSWAVRDRQAVEWTRTGVTRSFQYEYRPLDEISADLQLAVLVGEDINFFSHGGIDLSAVREAVGQWWAGGRLRGASTISQQLAKNLYLSNERSWLRKLREAKLAWWLERRLGKRRILELYLNVIEFDEGVLGVEAAAQHFYRTRSDRVTGVMAAGLAAAIPAPRTANPSTATRAWQNRRAAIERRMSQADWLRRLLE